MNNQAAILSQLGIEKAARAFNKSTAIDTKVSKFINNNFQIPSIFKEDRFDKWIEALTKDEKVFVGVLDLENKLSLLDSIINGAIKEEVKKKEDTFSDYPLSDEVKKEVKLALKRYEASLKGVTLKAKRMSKFFKDLEKVEGMKPVKRKAAPKTKRAPTDNNPNSKEVEKALKTAGQ